VNKQLRFRLAVPAPTPIFGLMDSRFRYIPSHSTDVRATFERVRAEQQLQQPKGKR
jgi:hypothetical protein